MDRIDRRGVPLPAVLTAGRGKRICTAYSPPDSAGGFFLLKIPYVYKLFTQYAIFCRTFVVDYSQQLALEHSEC